MPGRADWTAGRAKVPGGHIAFHRTGGSGPTLVLSHGLTDNGLCWERFATAMAPDFDLIMLDARGHGDSSPMPIGEGHDPATDIEAAIDQLGLIAPIVMGHSVGARATASYANTHPGRVAKVILEDPPFLPLAQPQAAEKRQIRFREQVEKFAAMSDAEITAFGKVSSPLWHEDEFPAWTQAKRQVDPVAMPDYRIPWQETIDQITAPTLLVHGDAALGSLVTAEIAAEAVRLNPRITAVMIPRAGHNTRRDNFPDFLTAVRRFLALK